MLDLYSFLCDKMLAHENKEMIFAHAYMVIAWNLMRRSSNAFGIRHSHMEWRGDALQIYFAHMGNDQGGDRPRDPRHVYANPLQPVRQIPQVLDPVIRSRRCVSRITAPGPEFHQARYSLNAEGRSNILFVGLNSMPIVDGSSFACWLVTWWGTEYLFEIRGCW